MWPEIEVRVRRILLRRGAPPSTVDDAVQTAALRAIQRPDGFDCVDGLVNWVTKVAWHEVQMEWHRQARTSTGAVPEVADELDPARVVESELDLDATVCALSILTPTDRAAILSRVAKDGSTMRPESAAAKMRLLRARRRLAAILRAEEVTTRSSS